MTALRLFVVGVAVAVVSVGVARGGWTPLHTASAKGDADAVRRLLASGANPNVKADKRSPLHLAVERGYLEVVRLLIDGGAEPNVNKGRVRPNRTPLHLAVERGDLEAVRLLLEGGADPNIQKSSIRPVARSPLNMAVERRRTDIVRLLLEHGANPNVWDHYGITRRHSPLEIAVGRGDATMTRLLVDHGAKYKGWAYTPEQQEAVRSLIRESAGRNIYVDDSGALRDLTREETGGTITAEPVAEKTAETAGGDSAAIDLPATAVAELPPFTPADQDKVLIERARRVALAYTENLPNFVCTQTKRVFRSSNSYGAMWAHLRPESKLFAEEYIAGDWRQIREAAAEVQFVDRRESYRNVTINGRPSKKGWKAMASRGEFGTVLNYLFRPEAGVKFTRSGEAVIGGREVAIFRYEMTNPSFGYRLRAKKPYVNVGHRGLVSIDKATGHMLRYDVRELLEIPSDFPYWQVSHSVDYGYVPIGGKPHLLPVRSRWVTCFGRKIERDDIEWTNCRKFGAESTVDFE